MNIAADDKVYVSERVDEQQLGPLHQDFLRVVAMVVLRLSQRHADNPIEPCHDWLRRAAQWPGACFMAPKGEGLVVLLDRSVQPWRLALQMHSRSNVYDRTSSSRRGRCSLSWRVTGLRDVIHSVSFVWRARCMK